VNPPAETAARPALVAEDLFRHEGARIVAALIGHLGVRQWQLAEDVAQEALVRALQTWPYRGIPDNPAAWLTQTAKNLALDALRRERTWREKEDGVAREHARWLAAPPAEAELDGGFADDTLRLMFICFHPHLSPPKAANTTLSQPSPPNVAGTILSRPSPPKVTDTILSRPFPEAQTALALRVLCGFSPAEIAAAFLTSEAAISKRLVRARQRVRDLDLPFAFPEADELPARLDGVLGALYLLFNEGYKASTGDRLVRAELCHEAIRLALLLAAHPATRAPRVHALAALMLLNAARLPARSDDAGNLLRLHEQNRAAWDQRLLAQGLHHLRLSAQGEDLSPYHLEAGVAACHSAAPDDASTDWPRILELYDQLALRTRSPVVRLNRAVAVARVHGPQAGLAALDAIGSPPELAHYHLLHAVRASFAAELGNHAEAITHFRKAAALATLPSEKQFLARRVAECEAPQKP